MNKSITVIPARKRVGNTINREEKPKLRVAAYCRVSTDSDEQATSYETQMEHYTSYIQRNPEWEFAGIFADEYNRRMIQYNGVSAPYKHKKRLLRVENSLREPLFCAYSVFALARGIRSSVYPLCL